MKNKFFKHSFSLLGGGNAYLLKSFFVSFLMLGLFSCEKEALPLENPSHNGMLSILSKLDDSNQTSEILAQITEQTTTEVNSYCGCRSWMSDVSESLSNFPENSYFAGGVYYIDDRGTTVGPLPFISGGGVFPEEQIFNPGIEFLPSKITLEAAYLPGPTFPAGEFTLNVICGPISENSTPFSFHVSWEEGQESFESQSCSILDSRCNVRTVASI